MLMYFFRHPGDLWARLIKNLGLLYSGLPLFLTVITVLGLIHLSSDTWHGLVQSSLNIWPRHDILLCIFLYVQNIPFINSPKMNQKVRPSLAVNPLSHSCQRGLSGGGSSSKVYRQAGDQGDKAR